MVSLEFAAFLVLTWCIDTNIIRTIMKAQHIKET